MLWDRECPCGLKVLDLIEPLEASGAIECSLCHQPTLERIPLYSGPFFIHGASFKNGYSGH